MSIEAMKQSLEALERLQETHARFYYTKRCKKGDEAITSLRQAIAEAEKQEPKEPLTDEQIRQWFKSRWGDGSFGVLLALFTYVVTETAKPPTVSVRSKHEKQQS